MKARIFALLGAVVIFACDRETAPQDEPDVPVADERAAIEDRERLDLFTDQPAAGAQLVFVGQDRSALPADRADAVFVPFSTFSVERDGIPNEFPPTDSLAALLEAAGVRGERFLIVGDPIPAGRAFAAFDWLGLGDRAALLDGGPAALAALPPTGAAPRDTGAAARAGTRAELEIDVNEDMIVDAEWVHEHLNDANVVILDARPPAEYSGETPGEGIDRPGHIPGARNVFWQTLVESEADPRLKDEAELRRIFEQAGVGPDHTVVAYCRTGGQGSFLYTVARHLGYDVRLYDGSYIDWSRTDYPVER
ncbi:MAG TPA: rhodanese-like domain-containing protein [Longimicrobiales bacterium]